MAYLLVAVMDIDISPKLMHEKGVLCDVYLDGVKVLTTMIPSTEENNAIVPLQEEKSLTFECHFGRPDAARAEDSFIGTTTLRVQSFKSFVQVDEWYELERNRLRCCTFLVPELVALRETPVERVFNAQNFLMVALENEMLPPGQNTMQKKKKQWKHEAMKDGVYNEVERVENPFTATKENSEPENRTPSSRLVQPSRDRHLLSGTRKSPGQKKPSGTAGLSHGPHGNASNQQHQQQQKAQQPQHRYSTPVGCRNQQGQQHGIYRPPSRGKKRVMEGTSTPLQLVEDAAWKQVQPYRTIIMELREKLEAKITDENADLSERTEKAEKELCEANAKLEEKEKQINLLIESEAAYRGELRDKTISARETQMLSQEDYNGATEHIVALCHQERGLRLEREADLEAAKAALKNYAAAIDDNEETKRRELVEHVNELHATLEQQARQVTEAYELTEERCRTFEVTLKQRDEQIETFRMEQEAREKMAKISEQRIESLLKDQVKYQSLVQALEEDLSCVGGSQGRLQDARNEHQRMAQLVERKDKKYDEFRVTMVKQLTLEQERLAVVEEKDKLAREKLDECKEQCRQLREENERLEKSLNQQTEVLVTTQQRLKLSHDMERKYAEKTAEIRLVKMGKIKMESDYEQMKMDHANVELDKEKQANMEQKISLLKKEMAVLAEKAARVDQYEMGGKENGNGGSYSSSTDEHLLYLLEKQKEELELHQKWSEMHQEELMIHQRENAIQKIQLGNQSKELEKKDEELEALRKTILTSTGDLFQASTTVSMTTGEPISKSTSCSASINNDPHDALVDATRTKAPTYLKILSPILIPTTPVGGGAPTTNAGSSSAHPLQQVQQAYHHHENQEEKEEEKKQVQDASLAPEVEETTGRENGALMSTTGISSPRAVVVDAGAVSRADSESWSTSTADRNDRKEKNNVDRNTSSMLNARSRSGKPVELDLMPLSHAWAIRGGEGGKISRRHPRLHNRAACRSATPVLTQHRHSQRLDELAKARRTSSLSRTSSTASKELPQTDISRNGAQEPTYPDALNPPSSSRPRAKSRDNAAQRDHRRPEQQQQQQQQPAPSSSKHANKNVSNSTPASSVDLAEFVKGLKGKIEAYVPLSTDPVDMALANLLNSYEVLPVPFYRQSPGNYLFGSRRTQVSIVGKTLVFRVGGGTMSFQQFIRMYQEEELQKIAYVS